MEGRVDHDLEISMITGGSGGCGGGGGGGGSRWNPTKEQIDMLEGLYKQGLRTPSAEQIQQITSRLRAFGHIEGKNVFYWFQNHKARQRQKQKQKQKQDHAISYPNRFLHPKPPGVCNSFYVPYPEKGLHSHHHHQVHHQLPPQLLLPRPPKRRQPVILPEPEYGPPEKFYWQGYYSNFNNHEGFDRFIFSPGKGNEENKETLELFPMRPSGNLLSPNSSSHPTVDFSSSSFPASKEIPAAGGGGDDHRAFYDFLCGNNGSCDR